MTVRSQVAPTSGGAMPLLEHFRELRRRLARAVLAVVLGTIVAWVANPQILSIFTRPYVAMQGELAERGIDTEIVISGVGGAFQFQFKVSLVVGVLLSSPLWLWQIWAFVLPALHRHEKKWAVLLTAFGTPLFVAGAVLAYAILPKAMTVLIGFIPAGYGSLVTGADYLDFVLRMLAVFGVAAEIPLIVVVLNQIGAISEAQLSRARPWSVTAIMVFAAVATPTTDPLTMLFFGVPMLVLYLLSDVIATVTDRRRRRDV